MQKSEVRVKAGTAAAARLAGAAPDCRRAAFTLVELTIVVAIIGLLVAIMIPAVSQVHHRAKAASSTAVVSAIGTALELFKADYGDYPPSYSDADETTLKRGQVADPYAPPSSPRVIDEMSGAGLLVWALAGADQLGTPGFKTFRKTSKFWSDDTDTAPEDATDPTASGAYALTANDIPLQSRRGPYLDLGKVQSSTYERLPDGTYGFVISAETNARGRAEGRPYPMFLDTFGHPILYWKADPAGHRIVDKRRDDPATAGVNRGVYHWEDNWALLDQDSGAGTPLALTVREAGQLPPLRWDENWRPDLYDSNPSTPVQPPPHGTFAEFIMNSNVTARLTPFRPDSYLLVSPGQDGEYHTGDDVHNFR